MSKEQTFEAGSLEWLEARNKNITATEVASLFGLNKYKSAKALARDKVAPKKIFSPHIRRGRILEPAVLQAVREDLGWSGELYGGANSVSFYQHDKVALSATPDAVIFDKKGSIDALVELKTASNVRIDDWDFNVPLHYLLQVHAQMMCVGIHSAYIACMGAFDPFPLIVYKVNYDQRIADMIEKTVDLWWEVFYNKGEYIVEKTLKEAISTWTLEGTTRIY